MIPHESVMFNRNRNRNRNGIQRRLVMLGHSNEIRIFMLLFLFHVFIFSLVGVGYQVVKVRNTCANKTASNEIRSSGTRLGIWYCVEQAAEYDTGALPFFWGLGLAHWHERTDIRRVQRTNGILISTRLPSFAWRRACRRRMRCREVRNKPLRGEGFVAKQ